MHVKNFRRMYDRPSQIFSSYHQNQNLGPRLLSSQQLNEEEWRKNLNKIETWLKQELNFDDIDVFEGDEERCFIALYQAAIQRGLVGTVITKIEQQGLKILGMKIMKPNLKQCEAFLKQTALKDQSQYRIST